MNDNKIIGLFMGGIINDSNPTNIQLPAQGDCQHKGTVSLMTFIIMIYGIG
jgi:hypothetical protein